ncbi:MAG: 6-carboxytetrahydropterin synthase [Candidatus Omnitrophica bacterium]|nr:6-carboxytetrahydropterin synthase [Candidatus Omnitrophota bacterium]
MNPTSENIAKYLFDRLIKKFHGVKIQKVTVWESEKSGASYEQSSK